MELKYVKEIPHPGRRNIKTTNNSVQKLVMDFYNSSQDYAELEFNHGEYSSSYSMYSGVKKAIIALDLPLEAVMVSGGVYLKRTD